MTRVSWTNVGLGLWLVVAAFVLPHPSGGGRVEDVVAGLFVALAALWAVRAFRPRISAFASWTVWLIGCWVATAPWVLGYARRSTAVANDVLVGLAVVALAVMNMWTKDREIHISDLQTLRSRDGR
jgi:hypothetical protein